MMYNKNISIIGIFILIMINTVYAGHIAISSEFTVPRILGVDNYNFTIGVKITNLGDEAAYDVSISPILPDGLNANTIFVGKLDFNTTFEGKFVVNRGKNRNITRGEYVFGIITDYKDANGYPFSSVFVPPERLIIEKYCNSLVSGKIENTNLPVSGSKRLVLKVRNLEDKKHKIDITLLSPRELEVYPKNISVLLQPRMEKEIDFDISSMGALMGSNYAVYAIMEYEEDDIHYTSVAVGIVRMVEKEEGVNIPGYVYVALLAVVIILFVIYQFTASRKGN